MKIKDFGPVIMIIVVLAVLAGAQGLLNRTSQPEMLQSQVAGTGNSLQDVRMFDLEIELKDDKEIVMRFTNSDQKEQMAELKREDRQERLTGEEAMEGIRVIVESSPPLTSTEPLTLIQGILDQLEIHQADVRELELEYELSDGTERKIELEVDKDRDDDDMENNEDSNMANDMNDDNQRKD
jgi:hypothetical protein